MGSSCSPATSIIPRSLLFVPRITEPATISWVQSCKPRPRAPPVRCLRGLRRPQWHRRLYASNSVVPEEDGEEEEEPLVQSLRIPESWMIPSNALQESEWLRVNLHKWLDDEYCPEDANVEISKVAAQSYYESLIAKRDDVGEILLNMIRALRSVSFQESFHGAFSSANAAVHLITTKMESTIQK